MSELNSKKKNTLLKFILIYSIIIILVTIIFIFLNYQYDVNIDLSKYIEKIEIALKIKEPQDNNLENENNYNTTNNVTNVKRNTLLDKYYLNNLEYTEEVIEKGNIIAYDEYSDNKPVYKLTAKYMQISGLKNKEIENKINEEIRQKAEELILDEEIYSEDINSIEIDISNYFYNSSDLISTIVSKSVEYKSEKTGESEYKYFYYPSLNYRLDTGEKLELEDIFTEDANIKSILAQAIYRSIAFEYGFDTEEGDGDLDTVDYGKIENEVYNEMSKFINQEEKNFFFCQEYIYVVIDDKSYEIRTTDYQDYINFNFIVDSNESLYEDGNNGKINYVFTRPFISNFEYFDKLSNNTFLSIYNYAKYYVSYEEPDYEKEYSENLKEYIDTIKIIIKNDKRREKDKGYIYNISSYYKDEFENIHFYGQKIEIDLDNFDKNVETVYALNCRKITHEADDFYLQEVEYPGEYKIYSISIDDDNYDGKLELGERIENYTDDEYYEEEYEYQYSEDNIFMP